MTRELAGPRIKNVKTDKVRLNVGCGRDYMLGWVNIDISEEVRAEHHLDIRKERLPFHDESVDEIYISGVLEQIGSNEEFIFVMQELYRVMKHNTVMSVVVPNAKFSIAYRDPMDVRKFTPETFKYFMLGTQEYKLYGSVYGFPGWRSWKIDENARHILTILFVK